MAIEHFDQLCALNCGVPFLSKFRRSYYRLPRVKRRGLVCDWDVEDYSVHVLARLGGFTVNDDIDELRICGSA